MNFRTRIPVFLFLLSAPALLSSGCEATQKTFKVTSVPPGATIYVNGEPKGQTDVEKLIIGFYPNRLATLRVEKDGYYPEGVVLSIEDREELFFTLKRSPDNERITDILTNIQRLMNQLVIISEN